jgi:transposase-like protein
MTCKYCGSENLVKNGHVHGKQFYLCKNCGHKFVEPKAYPKMRTKGRVVATAIDLYFDGLSVRKVRSQVDKIFGVKLSQVAIWKWIKKFSKIVSEYVETLEPDLMRIYKVDETAIKCKGVQKWFWEIIDEDTKFLVASHLSDSRTVEDVVALFEKSMRVAKKRPFIVYCDGLPAYPKGFNKVFWTRYKAERPELVRKVGLQAVNSNNLVERLHGTLKDRTKPMRGLKGEKTTRILLEGWVTHYNYVREHQSLGKTPAQASGIHVEANWHNLIKQAIKNRTEEELSEQKQPLTIEVTAK